MTCDVCGEPAEFAIVQPQAGEEIHVLCPWHLARFAVDRLAGRMDPGDEDAR